MSHQESACYNTQHHQPDQPLQSDSYHNRERYGAVIHDPDMTPSLTTEFSRIDLDTWILSLRGSVESQNHYLMWFFDSSDTLLEELVGASAKKLVIDLVDTERIDSEGFRRLFKIRQELAKKNIEITLRNPNEHLSRLLHIMQFDQVFEIEFRDSHQ